MQIRANEVKWQKQFTFPDLQLIFSPLLPVNIFPSLLSLHGGFGFVAPPPFFFLPNLVYSNKPQVIFLILYVSFLYDLQIEKKKNCSY